MVVDLEKGQKILLQTEDGREVDDVIMGLGWDVVVPKKNFLGSGDYRNHVDLDASCLLFNHQNELVDVVWFEQLVSQDGSVIHSGDNRDGEGEGDDEQIGVSLSEVPDSIKTLVFTVSSFTGQSFAQVGNAFCRLVDSHHILEVARYDLTAIQGQHSAQIMAKLYRSNEVWKMQAIGENCHASTFQDMLPQILMYLE